MVSSLLSSSWQWLRMSGNAQLLTGRNLVGIAQHVAVRLKNLSVQRGVAVVLLGNLREGVAGLHHVYLGVGVVGRRGILIRHGVLRVGSRARHCGHTPSLFLLARHMRSRQTSPLRMEFNQKSNTPRHR